MKTLMTEGFLLLFSISIFLPLMNVLLGIVAPPFVSTLFHIFWGIICLIAIILLNVEIKKKARTDDKNQT
jgi:uncharacterized membrane protein